MGEAAGGASRRSRSWSRNTGIARDRALGRGRARADGALGAAKSPDGDGYEFVCAPENEAHIYAQALTLNFWPKASEFGGPVKLIGCDPNFKGAPATGPANQALGIEGGYDYSFVEGTGHLLQIEKPDECVRLTLEFLGKHGLA